MVSSRTPEVAAKAPSGDSRPWLDRYGPARPRADTSPAPVAPRAPMRRNARRCSCALAASGSWSFMVLPLGRILGGRAGSSLGETPSRSPAGPSEPEGALAPPGGERLREGVRGECAGDDDLVRARVGGVGSARLGATGLAGDGRYDHVEGRAALVGPGEGQRAADVVDGVREQP